MCTAFSKSRFYLRLLRSGTRGVLPFLISLLHLCECGGHLIGGKKSDEADRALSLVASPLTGGTEAAGAKASHWQGVAPYGSCYLAKLTG